MNLKNQLIFWGVTLFILVMLFSTSLGGILIALFFVTFLFPVVFGTSFFFNHYLIPNYLLAGKKMLFGLYIIYMLIVSIWLELLVMIVAFVILADYQIQHLGKIAGDIHILSIILYLVVFVNGFIEILIGFKKKEEKLKQLEDEAKLEKQSYITLKENRKNVRIELNTISYIESLSDYVQVHTDSNTVITKEKISTLEDVLPTYFLRVHRSFLINTNHITSFNREEIVVGEVSIPIGRKFKQEAMAFLEEGITADKTIDH